MKVIIVGGVAAGAGAAARLRRLDEQAEIILLERGSYISFANCGLPYHLGGVIPERDSLLVMTPERFRRGSPSMCVWKARRLRSTGKPGGLPCARRTAPPIRKATTGCCWRPGSSPLRMELPGGDDPPSIN